MGLLRAAVLAASVCVGAILGTVGIAAAQDLGRVVSPILTLDREQLFAATAFGKRVNAELAASSAEMAAETREIEAKLEDEEAELTLQRETLEPEAFRALADAFDEKVQALRTEREDAQNVIRARIESAQTEFFSRIGPVLGALVRERGAVLILDRRAILLAATDVDITEDAILRIDATLGDGTRGLVPSPEVPDDAALDTIPAPIEETPADPAAEDGETNQ